MIEDAQERYQDNLAELSARLDSELQLAGQRKTSFENRAFAIFTLNLRVATLYLALKEPLGLATLTATAPFFPILIGTMVASAVSIVAAIVGAWPGLYPIFKPAGFTTMLDKVREDATDLRDDLMPKRIEQLRRVTATNRRKSVWICISLVLVGVTILGFAIILLRL